MGPFGLDQRSPCPSSSRGIINVNVWIDGTDEDMLDPLLYDGRSPACSPSMLYLDDPMSRPQRSYGIGDF
jgi:hypothetical protein